MKKIICIFVAAVLLIASGCASQNLSGSSSSGSGSVAVSETEKLDIMDEALSLSDLKSFENLATKGYGQNLFVDFIELYSKPLSIADYSISRSYEFENITGIGTSGEIIKEYITEQGFAFGEGFADIEYETYDNIDDALTALFEAAGETEGLEKAKEDFKLVERTVSQSLAHWLSAVIESYKIIKEETQGISFYDFYTCQNINFASENALEQIYKVKEIGKNVELERIIAASLLVMEATGDFKQDLKRNNNLTKNGEFLEVQTPLGSIYFGTNVDDIYRSPAELLILDLNGNDRYYGRVGSNTSLSRPIAVAIDFGGNDTYDYNSYNATQGCGVFGVGILINDFGDDRYIAKSLSQGACLYGVGVFIDSSGHDSYSSNILSQAAGYFGVAELADFDGNDTYYSHSYSQAYAGNLAVSFLVDKQGNDSYFVQTSVFENGEMADNFSQGCAVGFGSFDDKNALAGAVAILVDVCGNDKYIGASYVQGIGSLGGVGLLSDLDGNDEYIARDIAQATATDFAVGGLVDIGGNDTHLIVSGVAQGAMGAVLNGGAALFLNDGGNDNYITSANSLGSVTADNADYSYALFVETKGNDIYSNVSSGFGYGKNAFFIDGAGSDKYSSAALQNGKSLGKDERQGGVFLDFSKKPKQEHHIKFLFEITEKLQKEKEKTE